ncbi:hypothetical protein EIN_119660, partial [Entamoeba invadens IP1]
MRVKLEEFYLMNVVLYINTFKSLLTFSTINKKCIRVMKRLQINPLVIEKTRNHDYYYKYENYMTDHYSLNVLKLFPNIKTLYLPSYRFKVPKSVTSQIQYIKVANMNDNEFQIQDDTYLKSNVKYPIVSQQFPFNVIHPEHQYKFQTYVINSMKTFQYFVDNVDNLYNVKDLAIVVPDKIKDKNDTNITKNKATLLLQSIQNKWQMTIKTLYSINMAKGGLFLDKILYLRNDKMTTEDREVFGKIKMYFKVMIIKVKNLDTLSERNVQISFYNFENKIHVDEHNIPLIRKYSNDAFKCFETITLNKESQNDIDLAQINTKKLIVNNEKETPWNYQIEIPSTLKYLSVVENGVKIVCSQNVEIEVAKTLKLNTLVLADSFDFFELPEYSYFVLENKDIEYMKKNVTSENEIQNYSKMTQKEQNEFRNFLVLMKDLQVLEIEEHSQLLYEKVAVTFVPKEITSDIKLNNITTYKFNTYKLTPIEFLTSLTKLKISSIGRNVLDLDTIKLIKIKCYNIGAITINVNPSLKSIDLTECYKVHFVCRVGVVYLTHFDSFHTNYTEGTNIVVDYLIPYKERCEQGPCWADSIGKNFNYIKGMVYSNEPYTSNANGYYSPNVNELPYLPANILIDRMCYKQDASEIWFKAVKEIGDYCFEDCDFRYNKKIELSEGLTSFGFGAFCGAKNLVKVSLPLNFKRLPFKAFYNVTSLAEIEAKESPIEIDDYSLYKCTNLVKHPKFVPM